MSLETATYTNQLDPLNPNGALDYLSSADDHIRLIKSTVQNTFPRITGALPCTQGDLTNSTYLVAGGTANALTATFNPAWASYVPGTGVLLSVSSTNTGPATLNVNGLGAQPIIGQYLQPLVGGELFAGGVYHLIVTTSGFMLQNEAAASKVINHKIAPYTGNDATLRNTGSGTFIVGTNGHDNIRCDASGDVTVGTLSATSISATSISATNISGNVGDNVAKLWCMFNGTTVGTNAPTVGSNVTSITRVSVGQYDINFGITLSSANYCILSTVSYGLAYPVWSSLTTTKFRLNVTDLSGIGYDPTMIHVVVFAL